MKSFETAQYMITEYYEIFNSDLDVISAQSFEYTLRNCETGFTIDIVPFLEVICREFMTHLTPDSFNRMIYVI